MQWNSSRFRPNRAWRLFQVLAFVFTLLSATQASIAQSSKEPEIEEKALLTEDGLELKITYFKSTMKKEAPVAILLHGGKKGNRRNWTGEKGVASYLQRREGFAVIAVDLRGHGDSVMPKRAELKKVDFQTWWFTT